MATAKQLAALKKARAARAKNLKKKSPVKKTTRKTVARKSPAKKRSTRKSNPTSVYYVTVRKGGKLYYFTGKNLDTNEDKARSYSNQWLAKAAVEVLRAFKWPANIKKN